MTCSRCEREFTPKTTQTGRVLRQCDECRAIQAKKMAAWRSGHPRGSTADYQRTYNHKRRLEALAHYGGKCACCGESHWQFLTFDHIDGKGVQHRIKIATRGNGFVSWLHANNFPPEIRVLCHNCNSSLGYYKECPHDEERAASA